jgi:hypothetical protein
VTGEQGVACCFLSNFVICLIGLLTIIFKKFEGLLFSRQSGRGNLCKTVDMVAEVFEL